MNKFLLLSVSEDNWMSGCLTVRPRSDALFVFLTGNKYTFVGGGVGGGVGEGNSYCFLKGNNWFPRKGSTLTGKNWLPFWSQFFPITVDPFLEGT